jgi:hypothetical protein
MPVVSWYDHHQMAINIEDDQQVKTMLLTDCTNNLENVTAVDLESDVEYIPHSEDSRDY